MVKARKVHNTVAMYELQSTKSGKNQTQTKTTNRRPANPPARFAFRPKKDQRSTNKERGQAQQKQTLPLWIDSIRSECLKDNTATPAQKFSKRGLHEIKDQTNSICRGEPVRQSSKTCNENELIKIVEIQLPNGSLRVLSVVLLDGIIFRNKSVYIASN